MFSNFSNFSPNCSQENAVFPVRHFQANEVLSAVADKALDRIERSSSSTFRFRDCSMRAEMLEDGLIELIDKPLNKDGAVGGVKLVGVRGTLRSECQSKVMLV